MEVFLENSSRTKSNSNISSVTSAFTDIYNTDDTEDSSSIPSSDKEYKRQEDLINIYKEEEEEQQKSMEELTTDMLTGGVKSLSLNDTINESFDDDTLPNNSTSTTEDIEDEIIPDPHPIEDDDDDEFGDFEESSISSTKIAEPVQEDDDDDDDEFGDFSDASFNDFEEPNTSLTRNEVDSTLRIVEEDFKDTQLLNDKINSLLDLAFPKTEEEGFLVNQNESLLTDTAAHLYDRLTAQPYLHPIQWKNTETRRQLMQVLNIPDETIHFPRTKDLNALESQIQVPEIKTLNISSEDKKNILEDTEYQINNIEKYLSKDIDTNNLKNLMSKYEKDIANLTKTLSCWEDELKSVRTDHETFESVIENMVGFTQRVRREEQGRLLKRKGTLRGMFGKSKTKDKK